jgi:hypothetical protein
MGRRPDLRSGGMRHKGNTDQNRFGEGRIDQIDHRVLGSSAFVRDVLKKSPSRLRGSNFFHAIRAVSLIDIGCFFSVS